MSCSLLIALTTVDLDADGSTASDFTFQHRLCYDFESLIWVVVFAMMIHHKNILAQTDAGKCERYKRVLDEFWAVHAYSNLRRCRGDMMTVGCYVAAQGMVRSMFPDPREAAFFREAMRMIRDHGDGDYITYERLCALFRKHIDLAKEPQVFDVISK